MKSLIAGLLFFLCFSLVQADSLRVNDASVGPKLELVFKGNNLTVMAINESVEDIDLSYPFSLSYGGGGAGDLELIFRPVGRRPERVEGQLCAAIQQANFPKAGVLWAGAIFGRRFDISYVKSAFCLKSGAYDVVGKLYTDDSGTSISSSPVRVLIK